MIALEQMDNEQRKTRMLGIYIGLGGEEMV